MKRQKPPSKQRRVKCWNEFPLVHRPGHPLADDLNMVPRRLVESRGETAPGIISDSLGTMLEHHGYSDGRKTDSKSVFRAWTKQAGLVEKGNDREVKKRPDIGNEIRKDVGRAIEKINQGYRPNPQLVNAVNNGWH